MHLNRCQTPSSLDIQYELYTVNAKEIPYSETADGINCWKQ